MQDGYRITISNRSGLRFKTLHTPAELIMAQTRHCMELTASILNASDLSDDHRRKVWYAIAKPEWCAESMKESCRNNGLMVEDRRAKDDSFEVWRRST